MRRGLRRNARGFGARRVSPVPFVPSDITGLEAWYRGDDTIDADGLVATWTDKSPNGHDLAQQTATARPTPVTRAGQRALQFDGGDWLQGSFGVLQLQPITAYIVAEFSDVAGNYRLLSGDDSTNRILHNVDAAVPVFKAYSGATVSGGTPVEDVIFANCVVFNGASSSLFVNSDFASAAGTGDIGSQTPDGLTVGADYNGAGSLMGYVWEVILYSGAHDAEKRAQIGAYFSGRYDGLTVTT